MQKHRKIKNVPFPRPCGATGNDARKLHALTLCIFAVSCSCMQFYAQKYAPFFRFFRRTGYTFKSGCGQSALEFMTSLADLTVRRRKIALRVKDMTSAMGKDHHTNSSRPVRDSSHATGSNTTI